MLSKFSVLIAFGCLAAGCAASTPAGFLTIVTTSLTTATTTETATRSFTPTPWPTASSTPKSTRHIAEPTTNWSPPRPTPSRTPTPASSPAPRAALPVGLVYANHDGQWLIGDERQPVLIATDPDSRISPDRMLALSQDCNCRGHRVLNLQTGETLSVIEETQGAIWSPDSQHVYYIGRGETSSDIWVFDIATGEKRNLTDTPDREETFVEIWAARPDVIVFYSWPTEMNQSIGAGWIGYLTLAHTDGTGYQVISANPVSSYAAASPDGQTIAYTELTTDSSRYYATAWLYDIDAGVQPFPVEKYGFEKREDAQFYSPAWSPTGSRIAWWVFGQDRYGAVSGVGVFDLKVGTAQIPRNFSAPYSGDGNPPAPRWGPNGPWLAFYGFHEKQGGLWLVNTDDGDTRLLVELKTEYDTCYKAWSPNGRWLAFACDDPALASGIWVADLDTWQLYQTGITSGARVIGWIDSQP